MEGTTILFLAGLALTCGVLLFRTHRQLSGRPRAPLPSPATFSPPTATPKSGHRLDAPADFRRWEVEMHDLARDLQGQLDAKIGILQQLILDAEHAADRLEASMARIAEIGRAPLRLDGESPAATESPNARLRVDKTGSQAGNTASRRHAEIYALADAGLSSAAIAARVGSPIGEVELILGLRGNGNGH
jgi:hypothetical protein